MIISSQRYIDQSIVDDKIESLTGQTKIALPIMYAGDYDGDSVYVLLNGHHTAAAARELGIEIEYVPQERREWNWDPEWSIEDALENNWIDSDWYNFETGELAF